MPTPQLIAEFMGTFKGMAEALEAIECVLDDPIQGELRRIADALEVLAQTERLRRTRLLKQYEVLKTRRDGLNDLALRACDGPDRGWDPSRERMIDAAGERADAAEEELTAFEREHPEIVELAAAGS